MTPAAFLESSRFEFRQLKSKADRALEQLDDAEWLATFREPDPEDRGNPVAVIVKHLAGNLRSRWTDFLTSDGEKPDRDRDREFELYSDDTPTKLLERWNTGWQILFDTLDSLSPDDLERTVTIRGESHRVSEAIFRQLTHYAYHVGQIVMIARFLRGDRWTSLSVPRGGSVAFNRAPTPYKDRPAR